HEHHEEHPDERWLLTYADMITLLFALFIVLYAMGDVDPGKSEPLARSMKQALNGKIVAGGSSIAQTGGQVDTSKLQQAPPAPSLQDTLQPQQSASAKDVKKEEGDLQALKQRIDSSAAHDGLSKKIETKVSRDGLVVRLMTDDFLFDSGSADLKAGADGIMHRIADLLRLDGTHAVRVSGHTDSIPISGKYPTNWELSTARASAVVRALARHKVAPARMEAVGKAYLAPVASNNSDRGRSKNRRVEILIPRQKLAVPTSGT
ncbi:MAG: flagellar motor protein MotB, partial [Solirubrobacteraceae bacterium]|nr:flagellar motor protein MotB [Solirubrobacteraceae bacterium]